MAQNVRRFRFIALVLATALVAAACVVQATTTESAAVESASADVPTSTLTPVIASASSTASLATSTSTHLSAPECPDFTLPPDLGVGPVEGVSVTVLDKGHFLLRNATKRTYYFRVSQWVTARLVCGMGTYESEYLRGPIAAGETLKIGEGSWPDAPLTVGIWDKRCGEACTAAPMGYLFVPLSTIEPIAEMT